VRLTREVLPYLRAQRSGRIINIGSVLGIVPAPYAALYAASKHAVEGYSESLDHETREFGVRVTVVEPGYTTTSFEANATDADSPIDSLRDHARAGSTGPHRGVAGRGRTPRWSHTSCSRRRPTVRRSCAIQPGPLARRLSLLRKFAPSSLLDQGNSQGEQPDDRIEPGGRGQVGVDWG